MTRRSRAIEKSIFRKFSASSCSGRSKWRWPIFVTPSTIAATSRPKRRSTCWSVTGVSSTTSWRSAASIRVVSTPEPRRSARIVATAARWVT
jgi:hypothetical protein